MKTQLSFASSIDFYGNINPLAAHALAIAASHILGLRSVTCGGTRLDLPNRMLQCSVQPRVRNHC